jgi:hypothetical protein
MTAKQWKQYMRTVRGNCDRNGENISDVLRLIGKMIKRCSPFVYASGCVTVLEKKHAKKIK